MNFVILWSFLIEKQEAVFAKQESSFGNGKALRKRREKGNMGNTNVTDKNVMSGMETDEMSPVPGEDDDDNSPLEKSSPSHCAEPIPTAYDEEEFGNDQNQSSPKSEDPTPELKKEKDHCVVKDKEVCNNVGYWNILHPSIRKPRKMALEPGLGYEK